MMIRPLRNQVAVKWVAKDEKTASGLFIPDIAQKPAQLADVVAVGPGRRLKNGEYAPMGFAVGDRILVVAEYAKGWKYVDTPIVIGDVEIFLVDGESVLGVVEQTPTS